MWVQLVKDLKEVKTNFFFPWEKNCYFSEQGKTYVLWKGAWAVIRTAKS